MDRSSNDAGRLIGEHPLSTLAKTRLDVFHRAFSSDNLTPSSIESLRKAIRTELDAFESIKSQLAEVLNASLPIASLPTEVLCAIFELVARNHRPRGPILRERIDVGHSYPSGNEMAEPDWLLGQGGRLGWISLSHVCRAWRRALLAHTALWADELGSLPDAFDEVLARSGDLPLTLRTYGSSYRDSSPSWRALLRQDVHCRVQKIHCIETRHRALFGQAYAALTSCHFPILETLSLTANDPAAKEGVTLPMVSAPQLRELELINTFIPVSSENIESLFCELTFEEDGQHSIASRGMMRPGDLSYLLNRSRDTLSAITLELCIPGRLANWQTPKRIFLPKLRTLTANGLEDYSGLIEPDIVNFMEGLALNLNDELSLVIGIYAYGHGGRGITTYKERIRSAMASIKVLNPNALSCVAAEGPENRTYTHSVQLMLYDLAASDGQDPTTIEAIKHGPPLAASLHSRPRLHFKTSCDQYDLRGVAFADFLDPIGQGISIANIGTVVCGGSLAFDDIYRLLRLCTGCHTLQLVNAHRTGTARCMQALGGIAPTDFLPRLRHLSLTYCALADRFSRVTSPRVSLSELVRGLARRHERAAGSGGMPSTLTIDASVIFAEEEREVEAMMLALKELVPEVDWRRA
ncbi:unnamed protein product [Peniophora sp. CBMAI 1063]|nr:unnamed protein product [Peniophora sp. CBMAI 1063]